MYMLLPCCSKVREEFGMGIGLESLITVMYSFFCLLELHCHHVLVNVAVVYTNN